MEKQFRQFDIARALGVSEGYVSKIETDRMKPSKELLTRIAEILKVDIEELTGAGGE